MDMYIKIWYGVYKMRKITTLIIFLGIIPLYIFSQSKKTLVFSTYLQDLGEVRSGASVTAEFYYTNRTDSILTIKKLHRTCGCTIPKITKRVLKPGEYGKVVVKLKTKNHKGIIQQPVYFETDPPITPRPQIVVKVKAIPDVYLAPSVIFIPKISKDESVVKIAKVVSEVYTNFKIINMSYNTNNIKIKTRRYRDTKKNLSGYILEINFTLNEPVKKYFNEKIKIETTINKGKPLTLIIHGYIRKSSPKK